MAEIISIKTLLEMNLFIPNYQRPYKWSDKNVSDLLGDLDNAISESDKYKNFKYRIGTIILYKETGKEKYDIVDGQQRILTLILLRLYLENSFSCELIKTEFSNKTSQFNINNNYRFIKDWFALKSDVYKTRIKDSFEKILEVVFIAVNNEQIAFQLFDSQNTRGKALDPHDLLKAYHLREMKNYPYDMQYVVTKWEAFSSREIKELFELYLFPILQWTKRVKCFSFTSNDIDVYKGISENSTYTYAKRTSKAMPFFQIAETFIAGSDFFGMVEHYLQLLDDVKTEIKTKACFSEIQEVFNNVSKNSMGFLYAKNLFFCSILCYYDRFKDFDERVVKKLFSWAFMLRVDLNRLGFDSINKYAIEEDGQNRYSNSIPMFSKINRARLHSEIANMKIAFLRDSDKAEDEQWSSLYEMIKELNGYGTGRQK
ncbi:MAG: DUF262 domain-containing protein [Treponema sp.]|nr:DUF262 domain-containing protein [Treponema sp.]